MAFIATLLRQRQRAGGGWGQQVSSRSDSLVTAMVGLALEYTNPSVASPENRPKRNWRSQAMCLKSSRAMCRRRGWM